MPTEPGAVEGKVELVATAEKIAEWSKTYRTAHRQIRRWIARGRECQDPCPLDTPKAMPAWWSRCMRHVVPPKVTAAAERVTDEKSAAASPHGSTSVPPSASASGENGESADAAMDLTEFSLDEGQALRHQRHLVAGIFHRLNEAAKAGRPIDSLQAQYLRASTALRQLEKDDREDKVHRGKFLPRDTIERDAATLADMLRQLHRNMERLILELCPSLSAPQRAEVTGAIRHVRGQEARIFMRLPSLATAEDFLSQLAA